MGPEGKRGKRGMKGPTGKNLDNMVLYKICNLKICFNLFRPTRSTRREVGVFFEKQGTNIFFQYRGSPGITGLPGPDGVAGPKGKSLYFRQ